MKHDVMHPSGAYANCISGRGGFGIFVCVPADVEGDRVRIGREAMDAGLKHLGFLAQEAEPLIEGMKAFIRIGIPPKADTPYREPVLELEFDISAPECVVINPTGGMITKIRMGSDSDFAKLLGIALAT